MAQFIAGNANDDTKQFRGWLVGHFVRGAQSQLRQTTDCEIKWGIHPAGETRAAWVRGEHATTLVVLINGQFRITLAADTTEDVTLGRQGDYAMWGAGVDHRWTAETDSVVLTVRWPSTLDRAEHQ